MTQWFRCVFYFMKKLLKRTLITIIIASLIAGLLFVGVNAIMYINARDGLPVLGYHSIVEDEIKDKYYADNIYVMKISEFENHLKYLSENNYHTLSMDEVYDYYNGKDLEGNNVVLTFDDGNLNYKTIVEPLLEKYNFKATCFVISHKLELTNKKGINVNKYLRKSDLVNNETSEYYSHTYNMHHKIGYKKQLEVAEQTQVIS